ncbi:histone H1.01-like [Candoia aspera]|uniref:histone H1.01-like n=1 Tax=Candoia aspera TaxID=51853 RepID=UPI002FD7B4CC
MAEVAPAVAAKAPAKKAAGGAAKSRKPSGPSVTELLMQAVTACKERGGISLAALKKSLAASGYDVEKNNGRIKLGLRSLVTKGALLQTKGTGASGSFKLNRKQAGSRDKAAAPAARRKPPPQQPAAAARSTKKPSAAAAAKKARKSAKKPAAAAKKSKAAKPLKAKAKAKPAPRKK